MKLINQLVKALNRCQLVDMMYISKNGTVSTRRIRLIRIGEKTFQAFCFVRNTKRNFIIANVLAIRPVISEQGVS